MNYHVLIIQPLQDMLMFLSVVFPPILLGVLILTVGTIITVFVKKLLLEFFKVIQFDLFLDKVGLINILNKSEIKTKPSLLLSEMIYLMMMVMVLMMTLKALGITIAFDLLNVVFAYIPSVLTGTLVLIIGMLIAKFISTMIFIAAKNTDMPSPIVLSYLSKLAILTYVTIMFLKQIGFHDLFIGTHYTIVIAGVVFTMALAFGLAGRDIASKYLDVFNVKK